MNKLNLKKESAKSKDTAKSFIEWIKGYGK